MTVSPQELPIPRARASVVDERVDKALVRHFLLQYLALPAIEQNADFLAVLGVKRGMGEPELAVTLTDRIL